MNTETNFEEIRYVNGVPMVLRGVFFGEPVYSKATSLSRCSYAPPPITNPQATVITEPETIN